MPVGKRLRGSIEEINNNFDGEKIRAEARNYK